MDRQSDNFTAEMLLKQLGDRGHQPRDHGVRLGGVAQTLAAAGIPLAGVRIVDGSGLSRLDRVTAGALWPSCAPPGRNRTMRPAFFAASPVADATGPWRTAARAGRRGSSSGRPGRCSGLGAVRIRQATATPSRSSRTETQSRDVGAAGAGPFRDGASRPVALQRGLVEDLDAELLGLRQLRPGALAGDHTRRLLRHRVR